MKERSEYKKGLWTVEEDRVLMEYIKEHGKGKWNRVAKLTGLKRCGKSCRLRWINYLSPSVKRGDFSEEEEDLIIRLHNLLGNRWSLIAGRVPGRTDNQVKNHWNTHLSKKLGVRKGKTKIGVASQSFPRKLGENSSVPSNSNSTPSNCKGEVSTGQKEIEMEVGSQSTIGFTEALELGTSYCYESSFWFSNDDLNLRSPNLMAFLDESVDFFWQGL